VKKILSLSFGIILVLALISFASANCFITMHMGDSIKSESVGSWTCLHTGCTQCVNSSMWMASWPSCSGVCDFAVVADSNFTLRVSWPFANNAVLAKNSFYFNVTSNKLLKIESWDNNKYTLICPNCASYQRSVIFTPGAHNVTVRATYQGQIRESSIGFFIDNVKPTISTTTPASSTYTTGGFSVKYSELNVKDVILNYGINKTSYRTLALGGCTNGKLQVCLANVSLGEFDGKSIYYWFTVRDIALNSVNSSAVRVYVDTTYPVINRVNQSVKGTYLSLALNITEKNFYRAQYTDGYNGTTGTVKTLCSTLSSGICKAQLSFKPGNHTLNLQVLDKAGNSVGQSINFTI
jgi:hypothetical protein